MSVAPRLPPARILTKWDSGRLVKWLTKNGFEDFTPTLTSRQLDGKAFLSMGTDEILTLFSEARLSRRKQLAKCVTECKAQAATAKQFVGEIKQSASRQKSASEVTAGMQDEDEDDDEDWSWDTDFDDSEPENDVPPPVSGIMPPVNYDALNGINKAPNAYSVNTPEAKEECTSVSSIGSEASSYASGSSGSIQPTTAKRVIPRPPDGPTLPRPPEGRPVLRPGVRPLVKRPPSHPPPPPVQSDRTSSSPDTSEDYEIPISHPPSSLSYPPQYKPENRILVPSPKLGMPDDADGQDYAHVDPSAEGGDYEVVGGPQEPSSMPAPPQSNVPLPQRTATHQASSAPVPPPPLPAKPAHIREMTSSSLPQRKKDLPINRNSTQLPAPSMQPLGRKNYEDTSVLAQIAKRPLPPVPLSPPGTAPTPPVPAEEGTLEGYSWFHDIERDDVDSYLKDLGDGGYLVRVSKRGGSNNPYTLSIYYRERIFHLNIRRREDKTYALGTEKPMEKTFSTIPELIQYHQQEPIILTSKGRQAGQTALVMSPTPSRFEPSR